MKAIVAAGKASAGPWHDPVCMRSKRGPFAHNLLTTLAGKPLRPYLPRRRTLYLRAEGPRGAIASWGTLGAAGAWGWQAKRWIDRQYVQSHRV